MNEDYTLLDIVRLLIKHRKRILWMTGLAALVSIAVALLKPNYYKAVTNFYPASQDLTKPSKIFGGDKKIDYFGTRDDLDRILTISQSRQVYDSLVSRFDLFKRYDIDPTSPKADYKVRLKLSKLYDVVRTERDAIELSVEDRDPVVAARMANYARELIGKIAAQMIKNSQWSMIEQLVETIKEKNNLIKNFSDSISYIRKHFNIFNQSAQSEFLSTAVAETESDLVESKAKLQFLKKQPFIPRDSIIKIESKIIGYTQKLKSLTGKSGGRFNLESLAEGIPLFNEINDIYSKELSQNNYNKLLLSQIRQVYGSDVPTIQLIESAAPPNIKSRPVRSIIVIASTLLAFVFSILLTMLLGFWDKIRTQL